MKTRFHAFAFAGALTLAVPSATAQISSPAANAPVPGGISAVAPAPKDARFDIDLRAGVTAEEGVAQLTQLAGRPINVVWSGDSATTVLPSLRLHQVTLEEFFAAISAAGELEREQGRPGYAFTKVPAADSIYTFAVTPGANQIVASLIQSTAAAAANVPAAAVPKISRFFDLSPLLSDTLRIDDITTAIRTAWTAAAGGEEPPTEALRYHQETQLLIATAQPERLENVETIISLLKARHQPSQNDTDRHINQLKSELDQALVEKDRFAKRLAQIEQEKDAQVRELKTTIAELEIELAKQSKTR